MSEEPKITALAPWYGANRLGSKMVGRELAGCEWVGVPFAGGMSELTHIKARAIVVNDLHRHVINLARVLSDPKDGPRLIRQLRRQLFHPDVLANAQKNCLAWEADKGSMSTIAAAWSYFVSCWMARGGNAGRENEFSGGLPVRWSASGGDSNTRYRSATESLLAHRRLMQRCNFTCMDAFDFLEEVKDQGKHGLYIDAPWPDDGACYRHAFTTQQQHQLAKRLEAFSEVRIVVRFGDHNLIRELYGEQKWTWNTIAGRTQANKAKQEVLLVRKRSIATSLDTADTA